MARSRKKTPIQGVTTAASDKPFKATEHRRERSAAKQALAAEKEPEAPAAFGDPWSAPKDGKTWVGARKDRARRLRK